MTFYPPSAPVPDHLVTADFTLRPLTAADCDNDLEAMRTRANFASLTYEDNLRDLERHEQEHRDRVAFTYTVLDPGSTRVIGCLYITPVPEGAREHPHEGLTSFWIRHDLGEAASLEQRLFDALVAWLRADFSFDRIAFRPHWSETPVVKARQSSMYERAGLRRLFFAGEDIFT